MSDDPEKFLDNINPKFREWYLKQGDAVKADIRSVWQRRYTQEERVRLHMLQRGLLEYCREHGYEFP